MQRHPGARCVEVLVREDRPLSQEVAARTGEDGFITGASSRGKGARAVFELRSRVGNIQLAVVE